MHAYLRMHFAYNLHIQNNPQAFESIHNNLYADYTEPDY